VKFVAAFSCASHRFSGFSRSSPCPSRGYNSKNVIETNTSGRVSAGFWGWMHHTGPGEVVRVTAPRFKARKYIEVLEDILLPFLNILYP
jgi:hypothetical protein